MNTIITQEYSLTVPGGTVYARSWTPEQTVSDVPVVLLHDSLGCVDLWRDFPEILARRLSRTVYAYDRLGFGRSGPRTEPPGFDFIEDEAVTFFPHIKQGLSISAYILLGHSVGGGMAVNIAAQDTDCKGVITISAQAFVEDLTRRGIEKAQNEFRQPGQMKRLEKWHGEKAAWVLNAWTGTWLAPDFANWNLKGCLPRVRCPVLAIHGDHDEYGSRAFAEYIAGNAGGVSECLVLEGCGHMPHREKTDVVVTAVRFFLNQHGR